MEPAVARMARDLDRVENETAAHAVEIREGYLRLAALAPNRYAVVDAARAVGAVEADVRAAVVAALERKK